MDRVRDVTINDLAALIIIVVWLIGIIALSLLSLTMPDSASGVALIAVGWLFRGQTNGSHPPTNKPIVGGSE